MLLNINAIMKQHDQSMKVGIIGDSLAIGGAEKVHALLSVYFEQAGVDVHNCILSNKVAYTYSGSLYMLGDVAPKSFFLARKVIRFLALRKYLQKNNFDVILDFRMRNHFMLEFILSKFLYPKNTFYTVHSSNRESYFPKLNFLTRLIYKNKQLVVVSKAIQQIITKKYPSLQVHQIYNPIPLSEVATLQMEFEVDFDQYILAVGRMNDEIKQFDQLIMAYHRSVLPSKNIKLLILGEGKNNLKYRKLIAKLGLKNHIMLKGFKDNPYPYYKKALFTVLCSKYEGFPNALLESLANGTPVVTYDCFSGPNEIVVDQENGLLLRKQNVEQLIKSINLMARDKDLYSKCKQNATQSVAQFDIEIIGKQWLDLLKKSVN